MLYQLHAPVTARSVMAKVYLCLVGPNKCPPTLMVSDEPENITYKDFVQSNIIVSNLWFDSPPSYGSV